MRISWTTLARLILLAAVAGCLVPAGAADAKPDKKKSQAAMQRAQKAEESGQREAAIAAYGEALQADPGNVEAWRARGRAYQADGNGQLALADFEKAIELQPGGGENYLARAEYYAATGQAGARHPRLQPGAESQAGAQRRLRRTRQGVHGGPPLRSGRAGFHAGHPAARR